MADEKIKVRIYFKTDSGPVAAGKYRFDSATLKKLREDFLHFANGGHTNGGAYDCEVMWHGATEYIPTVLMLKFNEVLYIG